MTRRRAGKRKERENRVYKFEKGIRRERRTSVNKRGDRKEIRNEMSFENIHKESEIEEGKAT